MILFAVYKRVDGFFATSMQATSTIKQLLDELQKLKSMATSQIQKIDSSPEFDEDLSKENLEKLGIEYEEKDGKITRKTKPLSKELSTSSQSALDLFTSLINEFKKLNPAMQLKEIFTKEKDLNDVLSGMTIFMSVFEARESYINTKLGKTETPVDMTDLYDAVKSDGTTDTTMNTNATTTTTPESTPEKAPKTTPAFTKEMEDRIAKSVATQVKDSLLADRSTHNVMDDMSCPYASYDSNATAQGKEYSQAKPSPQPDMSEYIRKDSIPCWNCSLP